MEHDNCKSYPLIAHRYKIKLSINGVSQLPTIMLFTSQLYEYCVISSLYIQSYPCGIKWGSRRRWSAFSKTWNLPSRPLSSLYSSCGSGGIGDLICPSPTTTVPLLTSTPHSLAPTPTSLSFSKTFPSAVPNATPLPDPSSPPPESSPKPSPDSGSAGSGSADYGSAYDGNFVYDYKNKYAEAE